MKIAVTGSRGMIGKAICYYLRELGHHVFEIHRDVLDLTDTVAVDHLFAGQTFDAVIHSALYGREKIYSMDQDVYDVNMLIFNNLYQNRHRFKKFINLGTGNEYDTNRNIDNAYEDDIDYVEPEHQYGKVKNHISKICNKTENFTTLRLFGVMSYTEDSNRFFKRLHESTQFTITADRRFDYINLEDIPPVIELVLNGEVKHNQMNVVYPEKMRLSELARMFCAIQNLDSKKITIEDENGLSFTGDSSRLDAYNLPKLGIALGMLRY
jgi:nucleoside-diphosphate-sugar epimerase